MRVDPTATAHLADHSSDRLRTNQQRVHSKGNLASILTAISFFLATDLVDAKLSCSGPRRLCGIHPRVPSNTQGHSSRLDPCSPASRSPRNHHNTCHC
ncbi:hypothetical protein SCLCIDRAFT_1219672 [Scleroderma citrinum Foug A]|uniref:Uncharacterized protein n=1 Tax=Scleroderma citrinum Foug A TaxID=1036808 RepID=A0A0C2Z5I6_9AGAM|nr:hypothetical protein SCLCIDRAFT_1219672 [Scleroderma citrinum Foug A]